MGKLGVVVDYLRSQLFGDSGSEFFHYTIKELVLVRYGFQNSLSDILGDFVGILVADIANSICALQISQDRIGAYTDDIISHGHFAGVYIV